MHNLYKTAKYAVLTNRLLIGLLFLSAGIAKAVTGPTAFSAFFDQLGIPAPLFFTWVVMLSEIIFGLAVLANYKLEWTVWPLIIIMIVAGLTAYAPWKSAQNIGTFIMHLIIAANLWMMGSKHKAGEMHT